MPATAEEIYDWNIIWILVAAILQPCYLFKFKFTMDKKLHVSPQLCSNSP